MNNKNSISTYLNIVNIGREPPLQKKIKTEQKLSILKATKEKPKHKNQPMHKNLI